MLFFRTKSRTNRYQNTGYKDWAYNVKLRAGWRCQCCGIFDRSLHAHHIDNFHIDKRNKISVPNGVALCGNCHIKFHRIYGYRQNTVIQLRCFLRRFAVGSSV